MGVGFQVVRIHQIDEAAETFTLDFDMLLTWRDPSLLDVMEPDWEKAWSPMIVFRNKIEAEQISSKTFVSDPSTGVVFSFVKYHSTHYEMLELDAFPFDRQLLHLDISSSRPSNELCFTQFPGRENKVFAMPISMWNVVRSSAPPTLVTPERELLASADDLLYPRASFEIRVERRSQWYLANVLFVTWGTVVASAVTYSIVRALRRAARPRARRLALAPVGTAAGLAQNPRVVTPPPGGAPRSCLFAKHAPDHHHPHTPHTQPPYLPRAPNRRRMWSISRIGCA